MKINKWLIAGLGVLISLVFLWIAFGNLHPGEVWASIQQADIGLVLLSAAVYFIALFFISWRWQFLLHTQPPVPLRQLISLVSIGYAGNNIYPFRSGELLRIFLLQRNNDVPVILTTTTVVIERIFDGLILLTFVLLPLNVLDLSTPEIRNVANIATPVFIVATVIFFVLAAKPDILRGLLHLFSRWLPETLGERIRKLGEDIISGLEGLRSPVDLFGAVLTSYITWGVQAVVYGMVADAFGIEHSFALMLLVVGVVNLAGLIPASPGQFGVFEFFASLILVSSGVESALASAYAITVHMVIWLPVTILGLVLLLRQGLNLGALSQPQQLNESTTH